MVATNWGVDGASNSASPARHHRVLLSLRKHPYLSIFALAILVRSALAIFIYARYDGTLFLDDATYSDLAAQKATGDSRYWDAYSIFLYERTATMLVPLTALYEIFGVSRLIGQLLVAITGALTAVASAASASRALGPKALWLCGVGIAVMPSQVVFSSTTLKDAFVWALLAFICFLLVRLNGAAHREAIPLALALFTALTLLGFLRLHTQVAAALALVLAAAFARPLVRRAWVLPVAVLIAISAPWLAGTGPAGSSLLINGSDAKYLSGLRAAQAVGGSALPVGPEPGGSGGTRPSEPARMEPTQRAVAADDTAGATLAYLPRGIVAVLLGPFFWQGGSAIYRFAGIENLLWYGLLILTVIGAPRIWRNRAVTAFPVIVSGGLLTMWALVEGNAGTAFRHRGEFVWAVWLLAAFGLVTVHEWLSRRRSGPAELPGDGPPLPRTA